MRERAFWRLSIPCVAAAVFLTRWPLRSEFLFSWDSANYALAVQRIDIAAHRPHPPGYLAYVAVARAIHSVAGSVNDSLVLWNIVATVLAALVLVRFAWELAEGDPQQVAFTATAGVLVIFSPLFWFYGEIAEIYASETLSAVVLAYLAWKASCGKASAAYWAALAIPVAASFKLTTAAMMVPLVAYGCRRLQVSTLVKAALVFLASAIAVGVAFLMVAPDLGALIVQQFGSATATSRLGAMPAVEALERLNRNFRDTMNAGISMIGAINVVGFVWWVARDRRLPSGLTWTFAALWTLPWLFLCLAVHIAKPGYLLPLLPFLSLLLAGFYARRRSAATTVIVLSQIVVSIAQFGELSQLSPAATGWGLPYRAKTLLQKAASDLQPLTATTAAAVRRSDARMRRILDERARCQSGERVVVAGGETRRLMWYLPEAIVIFVADRTVQNVAVNGYFTPVTDEPRVFSTSCPVLWVADGVSSDLLPGRARSLPEFGFVIDTTRVRVTRTTVEFD